MLYFKLKNSGFNFSTLTVQHVTRYEKKWCKMLLSSLFKFHFRYLCSWVFCEKEMAGGVNRKISAASARGHTRKAKQNSSFKLPSGGFFVLFFIYLIWVLLICLVLCLIYFHRIRIRGNHNIVLSGSLFLFNICHCKNVG